MLKRRKNVKKISKEEKGILVLAYLMLLGATYRLMGIHDYEFYQFMFQPLSGASLFFRYLGSIVLRLMVIATAFGLIVKKEFFRKVAIVICCFTVLTIYYKHPYQVFKNIAIGQEYQVRDTVSVTYELENPVFPVISMIFYYFVDITFSLIVILYLRKLSVKQYFHV
ncbi:MAG: hypothetical protein K8S27_01805 [Candidatus Omnitrophica bacterium]|nr:hypothetical protein [Candidatus Omnitrophota bacterium]